MWIISLISKILIALLLFGCVGISAENQGKPMGNYNVETTLKGSLLWGILIALSWL